MMTPGLVVVTLLAVGYITLDVWRREVPLWAFFAGLIAAAWAEGDMIGALIGCGMVLIAGLPGGDVKALAVIGLAAGAIPIALSAILGLLTILVLLWTRVPLLGKPALPAILPWVPVVYAVWQRFFPVDSP